MLSAFNPDILRFAPYPSLELRRRKQELLGRGARLIDFGTGDPIDPTPEFIRKALVDAVPRISQYPTVRGVAAFRTAVSSYLERRFNVKLEIEKQILPAGGLREAIYHLPFLLVDRTSPRKTIIGPAPGFPVYERGAIVAGADYYAYRLGEDNGYLLELGEVPESVLRKTVLVWLNYPHNPSGASPGKEYFHRQFEVAAKYGILLCSDECYVDLYFTEPPPSLLEVSCEGVLVFHSCSKRSGMTGYRTGFMAGDSRVLDSYARFRETIGVASPEHTQCSALAAWSDDDHVRIRRESFRAKRELFLDFFDKKGLHYFKSDTTFYFWLKSPWGSSGFQIAENLLEHGIIVTVGDLFGAEFSDYYRVSLVPSLDDCRQAINIWGTNC